ncbi:hypothetical protein V7S43_004848 [Phytophthora oleae]|uniref:pectin lyase n=1 Tax=Phytophthora oleae TaxID=2107226 RepID=A0ABD3G003_9STRA
MVSFSRRAGALVGSLVALTLAQNSLARAASVVSGSPTGFAAGTTGGGDAKPVYPTTIKELSTYLSDDEPRVIVLKQEFNFLDSEGSTTEDGCHSKGAADCAAKKNGFKPQDTIQPTFNTCDNKMVKVTYDKAAKTQLKVASNKTLVGKGTSGVLTGKGIEIKGNNVIVQNIHITNLTLITDVGRQMIVINFSGALGVTISNSDFDGKTEYSSSCDGHHYWGFIITGKKTEVTLVGNAIHGMSGRGPKVGGTDDNVIACHAVNNYFYDNTGHAFDVSERGYVLAEGNYFDNVKTPVQPDGKGSIFIPTSAGDCKATSGCDCQVNVLTDSGILTSNSEDAAKTQIGTYKTQIGGFKATAASKFDVASGNFGVGDLGGNSVSQSSGSTAVVTSTDSSAAKQQETEAPSTPTAGSLAGADTDAPTSQGSKSAENAETTNAPTTQGSDGDEAETTPSTESPDSPSSGSTPGSQGSETPDSPTQDSGSNAPEAPSTEKPSSVDTPSGGGSKCRRRH